MTDARYFRASVVLPARLRDARVRSFSAPETAEERRERAGREEALRQEGARKERAAYEAPLAALARATELLDRRAAELEVHVKPQILELVRLVAAEVLRREVEAGRYDLEAIIRDCLALARGVERGCVARLHPADHAAWTAGERVKGFDNVKIEWRADPAVERGSCRLETPYGEVARDLSTVTADVFAALDGRR